MSIDFGPDVPEGHRSGILALAGRPNVGKSTLLNAMVGEKVSIVTEVPGTTRNAIRGVVTREDAQLIFVDTPGLMKPRKLLNRRLNELVRETWRGVDLVCLVIDAAAGIGSGDRFITDELADADPPVVCIVNKIDRIGRNALIPVLAEAAELGDWAEIVPVSAATGENVAHLLDVLAGHVPEGPRLFPVGMTTDQSERHLISEIIREKFITRVFDEVPHSIAVVVEEIEREESGESPEPLESEEPVGSGVSEGSVEVAESAESAKVREPMEPEAAERRDLVRIYADIHVERDSQKGIVIGRGGRVLKEANTLARRELEVILGAKVYLDVRVKVSPDWQTDPRRLERLGY